MGERDDNLLLVACGIDDLPGLAERCQQLRRRLGLPASRWTASQEGGSNAEIGRELFVTGATVKTYVTRMLTKLDARDRLHAVVMAYERGVLRPGPDRPPDRGSERAVPPDS